MNCQAPWAPFQQEYPVWFAVVASAFGLFPADAMVTGDERNVNSVQDLIKHYHGAGHAMQDGVE
jgi:hypothetical protein